jgi:small conductance mechanosensitive channel
VLSAWAPVQERGCRGTVLDFLDLKPLAILRERIEELLRGVVTLLPNIIAAVVFLIVTWLLAAAVRWLLSSVVFRKRMRPALKNALLVLSTTAIWFCGLLITATIALPGLTPGEALAGLGIGSIAIGLAFKDIFENFLAGILIMLRKPMRIGDFVTCEGITGKVEDITIRDTFIRQTDGVLVMLPNAFLYKNPVHVLTDLDMRRTTIMAGIAYGENIGEAQKVLQGAVEGLQSVDKRRPIQIFAKAFGSSSIDFEVTWWTGSRPVDIRMSRDEVVEAVKSALDKAGIEIPFPYRTLTFKEPLEVAQMSESRGDDPARS